MNNEQSLIETAINQHGYFTALQAEECGYSRKNHHYHIKNGTWEREGRGLYRYKSVPETEFSQYWFVFLWSRNNNDIPQAVFSHETALNLYDLSDINPDKIYFTVPKAFRTTQKVPSSLKVYKEDLSPSHIKTIEGLKVTSPLKTLKDLAIKNTLQPDTLEQATKEALKRGLITKAELKNSPELLRYAI